MDLIVGASGALGGAIARVALGSGRKLRVLARPSSNVDELRAQGVEVVAGDLKDRASLDAACAGIETLITTANAVQRGGEDTIESVDLAGNRNLVDAAAAAGVQHFIFVSGLGASEDSPVPLFAAKARTENHLRGIGMPYTTLAPTAFMEVWFAMIVAMPVSSGQPVTLVGEGQSRHSFVSLGDVARFAVAVAERGPAGYLPLGGPEALSWRDVVRLAEEHLSRTIEIRFVPPGSPIPHLPPPLDIHVGMMLAGLEQQDSIIPMEETSARYGLTMTTARDVLARMLA